MVVMGALMTVMLLAALDQTIVSTALPRIATELQGLDKISWVATAYLLTSAITTPIYGKLSDLFGRKKIFQIAILIFLLGSVLCGIAQNMNELVLARGIQGVGAGGLISLIFAIVGDIIPPRERGRYIGLFTGVFGVSSVIGPLLGGFLTDSLSWRWVFFVNLPLGVIALSAVAARLHLPVKRTNHKIDYLGAGFLSIASVCLLLATVWGGNTYSWASLQIIGLFAGSIVATAAFIFTEKRAEEPLIPLRLFKNPIFSVSVILSLLAGLVMFAAILYIPLYQQVVRGFSPIKSGLHMVPLVIGLMGASIVSGRLISKFGKYKMFPIIGTLTVALGLFLFSHIGTDTNEWVMSLWMVVLGAGIGTFMQVMVLAIQNSVNPRELGTATSSATFFRSLGASLGGAVFGAILTSRLAHHLKDVLPNGSGAISSDNIQNGSALGNLPPELRDGVLHAFAQSFQDMFLIAIPFALLAFVVALFLKEAPLKTHASEQTES